MDQVNPDDTNTASSGLPNYTSTPAPTPIPSNEQGIHQSVSGNNNIAVVGPNMKQSLSSFSSKDIPATEESPHAEGDQCNAPLDSEILLAIDEYFRDIISKDKSLQRVDSTPDPIPRYFVRGKKIPSYGMMNAQISKDVVAITIPPSSNHTSLEQVKDVKEITHSFKPPSEFEKHSKSISANDLSKNGSLTVSENEGSSQAQLGKSKTCSCSITSPVVRKPSNEVRLIPSAPLNDNDKNKEMLHSNEPRKSSNNSLFKNLDEEKPQPFACEENSATDDHIIELKRMSPSLTSSSVRTTASNISNLCMSSDEEFDKAAGKQECIIPEKTKHVYSKESLCKLESFHREFVGNLSLSSCECYNIDLSDAADVGKKTFIDPIVDEKSTTFLRNGNDNEEKTVGEQIKNCEKIALKKDKGVRVSNGMPLLNFEATLTPTDKVISDDVKPQDSTKAERISSDEKILIAAGISTKEESSVEDNSNDTISKSVGKCTPDNQALTFSVEENRSLAKHYIDSVEEEWEMRRKIWLDICKENPNRSHGKSQVYQYETFKKCMANAEGKKYIAVQVPFKLPSVEEFTGNPVLTDEVLPPSAENVCVNLDQENDKTVEQQECTIPEKTSLVCCKESLHKIESFHRESVVNLLLPLGSSNNLNSSAAATADNADEKKTYIDPIVKGESTTSLRNGNDEGERTVGEQIKNCESSTLKKDKEISEDVKPQDSAEAERISLDEKIDCSLIAAGISTKEESSIKVNSNDSITESLGCECTPIDKALTFPVEKSASLAKDYIDSVEREWQIRRKMWLDICKDNPNQSHGKAQVYQYETFREYMANAEVKKYIDEQVPFELPSVYESSGNTLHTDDVLPPEPSSEPTATINTDNLCMNLNQESDKAVEKHECTIPENPILPEEMSSSTVVRTDVSSSNIINQCINVDEHLNKAVEKHDCIIPGNSTLTDEMSSSTVKTRVVKKSNRCMNLDQELNKAAVEKQECKVPGKTKLPTTTTSKSPKTLVIHRGKQRKEIKMPKLNVVRGGTSSGSETSQNVTKTAKTPLRKQPNKNNSYLVMMMPQIAKMKESQRKRMDNMDR